MQRYRFRLSIFAAVLLLLGNVAMAEKPRSADEKPWSVDIGVLVTRAPVYLGSDTSRNRVLPAVGVRYRDTVYLGRVESIGGLGLGVSLPLGPNVVWNTGIVRTGERETSRADSLAGMDDRGDGLVAGTAVSYKAGPLQVEAVLTSGLKDNAGLTGSLGASFRQIISRRLFSSVGVRVIASDGENMRYNYGVTQQQADRRAALVAAGSSRLGPDDLGAYSPGGGLREVEGRLSLIYIPHPDWRVINFLSYARLADKAYDSPLSRQRDGVSAGVIVSYGF